MAKNIILLSDGTGNSSAKIFKTNVWRLYQALDLTEPTKQVAYYDNGVGTSSFKLFAALGGIFGFGLKRNVIDIYSFCCRNYQPGDNIYGFGFSRGAFTIRVVAGFIARVGLIPYNNNDADLARDAETAYRLYRRERDFHSGIFVKPLRAIRDFVSHTILRKPVVEISKNAAAGVREESSDGKVIPIQVDKIHFLGVWDMVDAYGGPIEEITRAIDYYYWPLSMPDQFMNHKIVRACHALALEEERDAFKPVLWDDRYVRDGKKLRPVAEGWSPEPTDPAATLSDIDRQRISQVWFVGVHCDIGGGYPQDGLSHVSLKWMMDRAKIYGLTYLPVQQAMLESLIGPYDKLNDSRHGFAGYYRYKPRNLRDLYRLPPYKLSFSQDVRYVRSLLANKGGDSDDEVAAELGRTPDPRPAPKIHESVLDRIANGNDRYAPIVLPQIYDVVTQAGQMLPNTLVPIDAHAAGRAIRMGKVWDWVWARRIVYFLSVFSAIYLALLPLIEKWRPGRGAASPFESVTPLIDLVAAFLPNFAKPWLDAFRSSPGRFVIGVAVALVLMWLGGQMQTHIRDLMRAIWKNPADKAERDESWVHGLRSAGWYRAFWYVVKIWILPAIVATIMLVVLLYAGFILLNRTSFGLFDVTGNVCVASTDAKPITATPATVPFETKSLCTPTKLTVERHKSYRVTVTITEPWEDGYDPVKNTGILTGPEGFGYDKMTWRMMPGLPIRRHISSNWFEMIARIGNRGFGEVKFKLEREEPPRCQCPPSPARYTATLKAHRDGELFFYVNDSVLGLPDYFDLFYRWNNRGKADVTVELLPD